MNRTALALALAACGLPARITDLPRRFTADALLGRMAKDKKNRDGKMRFVLLRRADGAWRIAADLADALAAPAHETDMPPPWRLHYDLQRGSRSGHAVLHWQERGFAGRLVHVASRAELGWPEPDPHVAAFDRLEAHSLLELEPPAHTRLRTLVNRAFVSRIIDRLTPEITDLCHQAIDRFEKLADAQPYNRRASELLARALYAHAKVDQEMARIAGKLNNEKFVANANPEVVAAERERYAELEVQKASLETALKRVLEAG